VNETEQQKSLIHSLWTSALLWSASLDIWCNSWQLRNANFWQTQV